VQAYEFGDDKSSLIGIAVIVAAPTAAIDIEAATFAAKVAVGRRTTLPRKV
jgi:hypothetical protein